MDKECVDDFFLTCRDTEGSVMDCYTTTDRKDASVRVISVGVCNNNRTHHVTLRQEDCARLRAWLNEVEEGWFNVDNGDVSGSTDSGSSSGSSDLSVGLKLDHVK